MIEFALKPLWHPDIPLELFMTEEQDKNFRTYLHDATVTQLQFGSSCQDAIGDCYGNGDICLPKYNPNVGAYIYVCENPGRANQVGSYEYDVYVLGLEVSQYDPEPGYPNWWGHHTPTVPKWSDGTRLTRQYGIFGYNEIEVFDRETSLGKRA